MSKEYHPSNNFYTTEELTNFTGQFTDRSLINISAFIATKTNRKYGVIERQLVNELNERIFKNNVASLDIQNFLNDLWLKHKDDPNTKELAQQINKFLIETWHQITQMNWVVIGKWSAALKDFEEVGK